MNPLVAGAIVVSIAMLFLLLMIRRDVRKQWPRKVVRHETSDGLLHEDPYEAIQHQTKIDRAADSNFG